jgi:hypothetical protein
MWDHIPAHHLNAPRGPGAVVAAALGITAPCPECGEPLPVTVDSARVKHGRGSYTLTVGDCEAWCRLLDRGPRRAA